MVPGDVGGSEEYTTRLLRSLSDAPAKDLDLRLAGMRGFREAHPDLVSHITTSTAALPGTRRAVRLATENSWLAATCRGADLVHHFGGHIPAIRGGPASVTIHDTQPLDLPHNFSSAKRAYMSWMLPRTARRARLVCTPSRWVADQVAERFGVDEANLAVVPSTWDDRLATNDDSARSDLLHNLVDRQVIVYPAVTHPHKNHCVLVEAVARLAPSHPELRLVLTGSPGRAADEIDSLVVERGIDELVIRPGRLPSASIAALIQRADVLAFPSLYEGFGLPVLEAMRGGTPVVAADTTALPEVLGGSGLLIPPDDIDGWTVAMETVLAGGSEIDSMIAAGLEQSGRYSPAESANRLLGAWRRAAN